MRTLLCAFLLFGALALQAAGIIIATPAVPAKNTVVTFTLSGVTTPLVDWDFGDGQGQAGGQVTTHTFRANGLFPVRATYVPLGAQSPTSTLLQLHVANLTGPAAPFTISSLRLRWEDGRTDQSVDRDFLPLIAYADLKFEGTGLFQAQWTVDGIPIGIFTEQLAFANTVVFDTRRLLPLPTTDPGEHIVSLQILSPPVTFQVPRIRYFVRMESQEPPRVDSVTPSTLLPGQEMELRLTGRKLAKGVRLYFGRGIAIVAPLHFPEPGQAVVRVFVSPTARTTLRKVTVVGPSGRSQGPATIQVVPPAQPPGGTQPAP
jgi:hypothetical protein